VLWPLATVAIAAWIGAQTPSGGTDTLDIRWSAPAGCPQSPQLRARVDALHEAAERTNWRKVDVRGDVRTADDGRLVLELRLERHEPDLRRIETRTLRSNSCEVLTDAAALLVSVASDPVVVPEADIRRALAEAGVELQRPAEFSEVSNAEAPEPTYQPQVRAQPPTSREDPSPPVADESPVAAPQSQRATAWVGAAAWVASGPLPRAQPGMEIDAGPVFGPWSLRVGGAFTAPGRFALRVDGEGTSSGAVAWTAQGRARGCYAVSVRPALELPFCVGAEAGAVVARGFGLDSTRRTALPWVAGLASVDVQVRLTRFVALFVGAEGFLGPLRPVLTVGGVDTPVTRASLGGVRGRLGVRIQISRR